MTDSTHTPSDPQRSKPRRPPARGKSTLRSFRHAWEGVVFAFSTQKHMRVHAVIIVLVVSAAIGLNVPPMAFLHLLLAMVLVLITELFNSAIEYAIDLAVDRYDPRAKVAKDVAAGAVLVASVYSVVAGVIVFVHQSDLPQVFESLRLPRHFHFGALQLTAVGLIAVALIVATVKHFSARGRLTFGGPVSGHAAIGFLLATAITFLTGSLPVAILAIAMALLIAQSRLQTQVHSAWEVLLGGVLGVAVGALLFGGLPR